MGNPKQRERGSERSVKREGEGYSTGKHPEGFSRASAMCSKMFRELLEDISYALFIITKLVFFLHF